MNTNIRSATNMEKAKANAVGFSAFLVVLMLTVAIAFTAIALDGGKKKGDNTDPVAAPVVFAVPVSGTYQAIKEYYNGLQYNKTTKRWEGHYAVDFAADEGASVLATYEGTVSDVSYNSVSGKTITIEHKDGLKTVYKGLSENVNVTVGQVVTKGQVIGSIGNTMSVEKNDGPHVHIEVLKSNKKVNPADYIPYGK